MIQVQCGRQSRRRNNDVSDQLEASSLVREEERTRRATEIAERRATRVALHQARVERLALEAARAARTEEFVREQTSRLALQRDSRAARYASQQKSGVDVEFPEVPTTSASTSVSEQLNNDSAPLPLQGASTLSVVIDQPRPTETKRPRPSIAKPSYVHKALPTHGDQALPRFYTPVSGSSNVHADFGCSLYEALATFKARGSQSWQQIKVATMQHFIFLYNNEDHPLHQQCREHTETFRKEERTEIFAALECPDMLDWNVYLLWVVAGALGVSLQVFGELTDDGEPRDWICTIGSEDLPCLFLLHQPSEGNMLSKFSALVADETGKDHLGFLVWSRYRLDRDIAAGGGKYHGLRMERVSWASTKIDGQPKVTCYNGFRDDSREEHLATAPDNPGQLHTFQMVVSDPRQIRKAVEILKEAMDRALDQRQEVKVSQTCERGTMHPHCSADGEFKKVPAEKVEGRGRREIDQLVARGEVENLVSVLTFAVGHLVVHFLLLHMVEHANEHTEPGMRFLAEEIVFNPKIDKWWWNIQQDVLALHNLFAHVWQGTPREPYYHLPWSPSHQQVAEPIKVIPTFKITSPFLNGKRPDNLNFVRELYACDLHKTDGSCGALSEQGFACPCATGNHDISSLLSDACRQQGRNLEKLPWTRTRPGVKFAKLVERLLNADRRFEILKAMKDTVIPGLEQEFYQSLGQLGMEYADDQMMYATGDALVPGIILEILLSGDAELILTVLEAWIRAPDTNATTVIKRSRQQEFAGTYEGVPLFVDNPRPLDCEANKNFKVPSDYITSEEFLAPAALAPWEHDEQVRVLREIHQLYGPQSITLQKFFYEPLKDYQLSIIQDQKRELCRRLTDITKIRFPITCVSPLNHQPTSMIVRSNITTSEALVQYLLSLQQVHLPPGLGIRPGTPTGIPAEINRVPGQDLAAARNIFDALDGGYNEEFHALGPAINLAFPAFFLDPKILTPDDLAAAVWVDLPQKHSPVTYRAKRDMAKRLTKAVVDKEKELNEKQGRPSFVDPTDVLDPEGRGHRRRMESAPDYLRQPLHLPIENEDRSWVSVATMKLDVLEAMPDDLVEVDGEIRGAY